MSDEGLLATAEAAPTKEHTDEDPTTHLEADAAPTISHVVDQATEEPEAPTPPTRPEGLPDKFWNEKEGVLTDQLIKSYQELEGKFRAGKHKPPTEGYNLHVVEDAQIDPHHELVQSYTAWAQKWGLSQDAFDELAKDYLVVATNGAEQTQFDRESELKSLGPNGEAVVNSTVEWAQSLVKKGVWSGDDFEEFKHFAGTANGIRAVNKLRRFYGEQPIPVSSAPVDSQPSHEELYAMVGDERYGKDPAFTAKVEKAFVDAFGTEPSSTPAVTGMGFGG